MKYPVAHLLFEPIGAIRKMGSPGFASISSQAAQGSTVVARTSLRSLLTVSDAEHAILQPVRSATHRSMRHDQPQLDHVSSARSAALC